ncbi:hypothetical protein POM88_028140 [Heracleum sosnowskyi]|uniref:FH2 domain-containing protein n=1 Tax=Heracleum sosnowskyi TaxID=360622 RepID=A0AAD8I9C5_9APIA|nr:hypothetical protein POM88_028140 [Heracleum sosnowskyi]
MLFRSNYDSNVLFPKQSLQTLEYGRKELRTRGLLQKLIESVLKAGNQMKAGTSGGNTQAFNLTSSKNSLMSKKSATLDYDALSKAFSTLSDEVAEIRKAF